MIKQVENINAEELDSVDEILVENEDELVGWDEKNSPDGDYEIYRKIIDGKGKWKAKNRATGEIFDITYDQARGYEPIKDTAVKQLSRKLGKKLLPQNEGTDLGNNDINDIAKFISKNLRSIQDQGFANVLRGIIFSSDINWDYASKLISKFMPETLAEGIELEEPSDEEIPEELEILDKFNDEQEDIDFYEEDDTQFIDIANDNEEDLQIEEGFTHSYDRDEYEEEFTEIASKSVPDSDGFSTDYTMYRNTSTGEYVFVFGDKDIYSPEDGNFDWSCDTEEEAWEWYDSYEGISDEDEEED